MMLVVAYDVNSESEAGRRRLRRMAKVCENCGQRLQNSVFECLVDAAGWTRVRAQLIDEISGSQDSLRFIFWETTGSGEWNTWERRPLTTLRVRWWCEARMGSGRQFPGRFAEGG